MFTREELYRLVWSTPMTKVAEQLGVSGSYMARVCTALRVPRPERGYWAKLAVGKAPSPPGLPDARPGDQVVWSKGDDLGELPHEKPVAAVKPKVRKPKAPVSGNHALVRGAKSHFEAGRAVKDGEHLKPYKKLLLDLISSRDALDRALGFASTCYNALESAGHRVVIAPPGEHLLRVEKVDARGIPLKRHQYDHSNLWSPCRPTVVYVGSLAIGLVILETTETVEMRYVNGKFIRNADYSPKVRGGRLFDDTWTTTQELPSGRLRLLAYSPYWKAPWFTQWDESKKAALTEALPAIVSEIESAAIELAAKLDVAEREAEIARQKRLAADEARRIDEDRRLVEKSIKDSHGELQTIIQTWAERISTQQFLDGVAEHASILPLEQKQQVHQRLDLARVLIGSTDPLDYFLAWKAPSERYQPKYDEMRKASQAD